MAIIWNHSVVAKPLSHTLSWLRGCQDFISVLAYLLPQGLLKIDRPNYRTSQFEISIHMNKNEYYPTRITVSRITVLGPKGPIDSPILKPPTGTTTVIGAFNDQQYLSSPQ